MRPKSRDCERLLIVCAAQGISTLLEAEKEAAKVVAKAREYRNQRVKDARGEASKEIDELRASKDAEFKAFQAQHSGDRAESENQVDKDTDKDLAQISASFESHREEVVAQLLDRVVQVAPALHRNYKPTA